MFRWLPESARWLLANGRAEEAQRYLVQCAKMNGKNENTSKLDTEVQLTSAQETTLLTSVQSGESINCLILWLFRFWGR